MNSPTKYPTKNQNWLHNNQTFWSPIMNNNQNSNSNPTFYPLLTTNFKTEILKDCTKNLKQKIPQSKIRIIGKKCSKKLFHHRKKKSLWYNSNPKETCKKEIFSSINLYTNMAIRPGVNSTLNFKKYKTEFYKNYNNS